MLCIRRSAGFAVRHTHRRMLHGTPMCMEIITVNVPKMGDSISEGERFERKIECERGAATGCELEEEGGDLEGATGHVVLAVRVF